MNTLKELNISNQSIFKISYQIILLITGRQKSFFWEINFSHLSHFPLYNSVWIFFSIFTTLFLINFLPNIQNYVVKTLLKGEFNGPWLQLLRKQRQEVCIPRPALAKSYWDLVSQNNYSDLCLWSQLHQRQS